MFDHLNAASLYRSFYKRRYAQDVPVLSARDVAQAIRDRVPGIPTTSVHKLLYYCQGHHLRMTGEVLFRETISAWDLGPVVGELWKEEKKGTDTPPAPIADEGALNTIGYVVSRYGGLTAQDLVTLTHNEGPWQQANVARLPKTSVRIPVDAIRDYFTTADEVLEPDEPGAVVLDSSVVVKWLSTLDGQPDLDAPVETIAELRAIAGLAGA
jgi:uncharacterized phage-associated protein